MGYERLRWFSYMAPNGCAMRCHITTANNIMRNEFIINLHKNTWYLSTSNADNGENDITPYLDTLTREMSGELLKLGKGEDKPYVEWFNHLVEKAKKGNFPTFCAEFTTNGKNAKTSMNVPANFGECQSNELSK